MIVEPIIIKQKLQNNKITDREPELPGRLNRDPARLDRIPNTSNHQAGTLELWNTGSEIQAAGPESTLLYFMHFEYSDRLQAEILKHYSFLPVITFGQLNLRDLCIPGVNQEYHYSLNICF